MPKLNISGKTLSITSAQKEAQLENEKKYLGQLERLFDELEKEPQAQAKLGKLILELRTFLWEEVE